MSICRLIIQFYRVYESNLTESGGTMSQSSPLLISARAIEDIIQIPKLSDELPKAIESKVKKDKSEDIDNSFSKCNSVCPFGENEVSSPKFVEDNVKESEIKIEKKIGNGSEGDYQNSHLNVEDVKNGEKTDSELELKSWPSDSDITVIRMKKEYRNELSTKVNWEEERNLTEEYSSVNFNWESHSLINLANITVKGKDNAERLTPFTIWSEDHHYLFEPENITSYPDSSRNKSLYSSKNFIGTSNKVLYCPPDEMAFYVPVTSQGNCADDRINHKPMSEILPVLGESIGLMYRTESLPSVKKKKNKKKIMNNSDFPSGGNKVSQSGKVKLMRSFLNFFGKCGSKKTNFDNKKD